MSADKTESVGIVDAAEAAYVRLLSLGSYAGRHTLECQLELCAIRDAIAECRDKEPQEVQEQAELAAMEIMARQS